MNIIINFGYEDLNSYCAGRCMAVDRKIAYMLFMCIQFCDLLFFFECLWNVFCCCGGDSGLPLAPLGWVPLRRLGVPRGSLCGYLASLWLLGVPVGSFGAPLASKWSFL